MKNLQCGFRASVVAGVWLFILLLAWTMVLYRGGDMKERLPRKEKKPSIHHHEVTLSITNPGSNPGKDSIRQPNQNLSLSPTARTQPPFYHHLYAVNCSAVFVDDQKEISRVETMLKEKRKSHGKNELSVPSDSLVANYSKDCDFFRRARDYPKRVLSREEEEFPLAFIILTHKNAAQVELLLRSIYQPQNVYAIHPDAKSPPEFHNALRNIARCFDNVFICSKLEKVQYAGYTRLLADINCMQDLVKHPVQWRYLMNQCGEAFPLKTNLEIVRQIKAYNGANDAEGYNAPHKLVRFHRYSSNYNSVKSTAERLRKYPPPGNISLYSGNAYNTFSRKFIEYVLTDPLPVQFLAWINKTYSPDEHYWASLNKVPGVPGGVTNITHSDINTSFVKWGGDTSSKACTGIFVRGICIMSTGYLPFVARRPHLFANKFHYAYDPVTLECLQELLTNRTKDPSLTSQYFTQFPVKRRWFYT